MSLIIETDLGRDPDDLFAILWLLAVGIDISAIVITPGDPDQLAIASFILKESGHEDIPIGAATLGRTTRSSGSVHYKLLERYGQPKEGDADGLGSEVIAKAMDLNTRLLVLGPLSSVGAYLATPDARPFMSATMQGGFCPYSLYQPLVVLDQFLDKEWMPTFNLNGDRKGAERFLSAPFPRRMVGKNVCHSIVLDPVTQMERFSPPPNRAAELFLEAGHLLGREKRFHDPVAAICDLHPEVGVWIDGKTVKRQDGWTTVPALGDRVLVDLDRDAFWETLYSWDSSS